MEVYAGNSLLYRYTRSYRQPLFLDRNLNYLFNHKSAVTAGANLVSDSGIVAHGGGGASHKRRRRKRRRLAVDEVCERLRTSTTEPEDVGVMNSMMVNVMSTLKIEATGIVKPAVSLRSRGTDSFVQLRSTNCLCKIAIHRVYMTSTDRRKSSEAVFQSSGICTLNPSHQLSSPTSGTSTPVASLSMDEPFYIKLSTLAEADMSTSLSCAAADYVYIVTLTLRPTSAHSQQSWPFGLETTPPTTPVKHSGSLSPREKRALSSGVNSPRQSASPSPVRQSPRAHKATVKSLENSAQSSPVSGSRSRRVNAAVSAVASIRRRLGIGNNSRATTPYARSDDGDIDGDKLPINDILPPNSYSDAPCELKAEFEFSLAQCPAPGFAAPLTFFKDGKNQELRNYTEIGLQLDVGWSVASISVNVDDRNGDGKRTINTQITRKDVSPAANKMQKFAVAKKLPLSDRPVEARYHFALDGKFKTYILPGYTCPWCDFDYQSFQRLHFHFVTCHDLFAFRVEQRKPRTVDVYISIAAEFTYERNSSRLSDLKVIQWLTPRGQKFKLPSFLAGDLSWLQEGASALPAQMPMIVPWPTSAGRIRITLKFQHRSSSVAVVDEDAVKLSMASQAKWYEIETVPDLPPRPKRRYPIPESDKGLYSTRSMRKLKTGEMMSESEDDLDESWLVHMHDQTLDDFEDVTPQEKMLMKAWDRHLFEERPKSYKHLADSFVRFCRQNRRRLADDKQFHLELWKLGLNLINYGMIEPGLFYACMKYLKTYKLTPTVERVSEPMNTSPDSSANSVSSEEENAQSSDDEYEDGDDDVEDGGYSEDDEYDDTAEESS
ncbi:hypothetical protein V1512DRAFT_262202 [Lipomyces arxii]|uniref:uncharacterized protein n=1 Tax=Lipomyces arxii TaxID=56418 RepID=UPI0034CDB120